MQNTELENLLKTQLELTEINVGSEGTHYTVTAVGACFEGVSRVKKQQLVYAPLQALIADGTIHAVSIKAFTPTEWQREKHFNQPS